MYGAMIAPPLSLFSLPRVSLCRGTGTILALIILRYARDFFFFLLDAF